MDKVKYNVTVNFNEIIQKLHSVAKSLAEKKDSSIQLDNLAFNDSDGTFIGGGQYVIMMKARDEKSVPEKAKFLDVLKEYVHYFVGEEESKTINDSVLQPILRSRDNGTEDGTAENAENGEKTGNDEKSEQGKPKEGENTGNAPKPTEQQSDNYKFYDADAEGATNESVFNRRKKLLDIIFEADETTEQPKEEETTEKVDQEDQNNKPKDEDSEDDIIGYSAGYDIAVDGKKDTTITDAFKNKSHGFFGGMIADLRNMKWNVGGNVVKIGQLFDQDKWREAVGIIDINTNTVSRNIDSSFEVDFPNNDIHAKVWGKNALINQLNKVNKLSPEVKSKINGTEYSVVIDTNSKDPNYSDYDVDKIAKTASKAFGTTYNIKDTNAVSGKDVIKIDDIEGLYKNKSKYDNKENPPGNGKEKKTFKESEEEPKKVNAKDGSSKNTIIYNKLKEQIDRELKDDTLQYGYEPVDKFLGKSYVKNLNDSEFTSDLKKNCKNVLFLITKNEGIEQQDKDEENSDNTPIEAKPKENTADNILEARYSKLIDMVVESIIKEAEENGEKPTEQTKKDYKSIVTKVFKNVMLESAKDLKIEDIDVSKIKIYEKDVDISDIEVKEAEENAEDTEKAASEESVEKIKKEIGQVKYKSEDHSYEIKTMEEILAFLKDGNYNGSTEELTKYQMGCLITETQKEEQTPEKPKNEPKEQENPKSEESPKETPPTENTEGGNDTPKQEDGNLKESEEDNGESSGEPSKEEFDVNSAQTEINEILKKYSVEEISEPMTFTRVQKIAESIFRKTWQEMLIESLFEDGELLFEKTHSQTDQDHITNPQAKELIGLIKQKTLKNIQNNKEAIEKKWGEAKQGQKDFQWPGKYQEQYDEFKKLVFDQEDEQKVEDYVNQAIHNKGNNAKLQKVVLTRFIPAIKQIEDPKKIDVVKVNFYDVDPKTGEKTGDPLNKEPFEVEKDSKLKDNEEISKAVVEYNEKLKEGKPGEGEKDGYTKKGWEPDMNEAVAKEDPTEILAKYEKGGDKKYIVTFLYAPDQEKPDDTEIIQVEKQDQQEVVPGEAAKIPEDIPTIEGYKFKDWGDDTEKLKKVEEDITAVAVYEKIEKQQDKEETVVVIGFNLPKNTISNPKKGSGKLYVTADLTEKQQDDKKEGSKSGVITDWYIIPHKRLRNMKERPNQESTDDKGVTTSKTSDAEYKP